MFIDAYNAYIVSKAFYEVNDEFFDVLYASAHSLYYTSWGLYGKEFMKSIDKAKSNKLGNLEAIFNSMFDFTKGAVEFAYDKVIKEALEQAVYPTVAAVLGCTNIGAVNSAVLAYNIGYRIVDSFLRLSDKSEAYKTMNAIAPIEGRLRSVLTTYRSNLINNPTEKNAKKYDMACGFVEYKSECDHSKCEEILVYSIVPTCKNAGYGYYTCSGCGERISDVGEIPAVECDYSKEEFEATCTENPYARYTCIYCLDSYLEGITLEELNNSAHEYTETITEATCVSGGYTDYYCNVCEHTYTGNETAINKDAHKDTFTSKTEPTCTEDGYSIYTCTLCGNESKKDEVPAKGHSYKSVVTKSTCTEEGYTTYACSVCGDTYQDDFVAALGHTSVTDPAVDATCTKTGLTEGSHCSVCGEVLTAQKKISALGHTYGEYVVTTEPTCTKAGVETKTCSVCGDKQTRPVTALGHTEVTDPAVAATCTETGLTQGSHCSVCGEVLTAQKEISALGHTYGEYVVTIQPTCTKTGVETKTCSVCGDKQTRPVPALGHTDADGDGNCDNCGEIMEAVKTCSHMCHKGGFSGFIWKLINLFNKLFRTNKTCSCGVNHY